MRRLWRMRRAAYAALLGVMIGAMGIEAASAWCYDRSGRRVSEDYAAPSNEFARAHVDRYGSPHISYNKGLMSNLSRPMQHFVAAHECTHHALGHLSARGRYAYWRGGTPIGRELEADCWAVRKLISHGIFSLSDVRAVMRDLSTHLGSDASHLSGEERARRVGACAGIR